MYLQENTLFDLDIGVKVTQNVAQYSLHHMTYRYAPAKFEVAASNSLGGDAFTRKKTFLKVIRNVAQYPLQHLTYAPAKFEVAMSNILDGNAFKRKYII